MASILILFINAGFTISLLKVDPAKALLLISLNPLWAALMGKVLLHDPLPVRTVVSMVLSLVSTLMVFVPTLLAIVDPDVASADLVDPIDLVPLATGVMVAVLLIFSRWQAHASLELAPCGGALLTALAAVGLLVLVEHDTPDALVVGLEPVFWIALVGSAVGSAVYDSALVIAPRSLASAEVALILLAETVFGPFWVWVAFDDAPDSWTLGGGGLLLLTLAGHELAGMLERRRHADAHGGGGGGGGGGGPMMLNGGSGGGFGSNEGSVADDLQLFSRSMHRSPQLGERFRDVAVAVGSRSGSNDSDGHKRAILLEFDALEAAEQREKKRRQDRRSHP